MDIPVQAFHSQADAGGVIEPGHGQWKFLFIKNDRSMAIVMQGWQILLFQGCFCEQEAFSPFIKFPVIRPVGFHISLVEGWNIPGPDGFHDDMVIVDEQELLGQSSTMEII